MWRYLPKATREGPKSHVRMKCKKCIFLGYDAPDASIYRVWDPVKQRVQRVASGHVISEEDVFPWKDKRNKTEVELDEPPDFAIPASGILTKRMCDMYNLPRSMEGKILEGTDYGLEWTGQLSLRRPRCNLRTRTGP